MSYRRLHSRYSRSCVNQQPKCSWGCSSYRSHYSSGQVKGAARVFTNTHLSITAFLHQWEQQSLSPSLSTENPLIPSLDPRPRSTVTLSLHIRKKRNKIPFTGCIHHIECWRCLCQFVKQLLFKRTLNLSCSFPSDLHVRMSPLSSSFCAVTQTLNSTHTHILIPWPMSAPCWHWLTIYLFLARRLVSLSIVTGAVQLSKWCKNRLKIGCNLNCWTGLHQFPSFQCSLDVCYGTNYPREGHWQSRSSFTLAFLDIYEETNLLCSRTCVEY